MCGGALVVSRENSGGPPETTRIHSEVGWGVAVNLVPAALAAIRAASLRPRSSRGFPVESA
jgi:hypothetical protein